MVDTHTHTHTNTHTHTLREIEREIERECLVANTDGNVLPLKAKSTLLC